MVQLNRESYQKLIDGDIAELNKYMPEHSLERKHIVDVLNQNVMEIYKSKKGTVSDLDIAYAAGDEEVDLTDRKGFIQGAKWFRNHLRNR